MNPSAVQLIIQGILAAVQAAPEVEQVVSSAKQFISALVAAKIIDAPTQDALHQWVDARVALAKQGIEPPSWSVEPDK